ncbi:zinc ABC transporter substrate-binding protein [Marinobacter daepoensis]|uniref:High-affinity zinc uptake system protein ZnuA n=1 Tax=Marinobacter daepoensis TaxID=262077 RepID=A0ABS3BDF1_9GAMM|nr:zinc ABC transporter substrate-binding protein [Marinobacter daepoensis]MBN7769522.1 zinc ABC transporter substrate-binding protein [Marinobacter daepoensis]MBY6078212.1 zinc ABC transporter substrate-binding protein [Marinobacter daepoensis]
MPYKSLPIAIALTALTWTVPASATDIVTSIKPLELLVKAVAGESVSVSTLIPPGSSPHNYSMKPSQRQALAQADVVFWVGPDMETFLGRLLKGKEFHEKSVAFLDSDDLDTTEEDHADHGHQHEEHDHHDHTENLNLHEHDHGEGEDPHIWVDPMLALKMATDIRQALARFDSLNQSELDANLARFEADLRASEQSIRASFSGLANVSLFAYHDAFTRYAEHYGLSLEGTLTLNPELSPGARHIANVQNKLQAATHPCLLTEPQFNRQWWRSITEGIDVTFSTWDPLATEIASTPSGYVEFQQSVAEAVLACLPEQAQHQGN